MKNKNVLILHTDQQRYDSLGCSGNEYAKTPNIDKLASDGEFFTRHISTNPVCSPSRASLLTGMFPSGHGLVSNGMALWRNEGCNDEGVVNKIPTIADILKEYGYSTASFGKLHIQPHRYAPGTNYDEAYEAWKDANKAKWHGPYYGFDYVEIMSGHGENACKREMGGHYADWLQKQDPQMAEKVRDESLWKVVAASAKNIHGSVLPKDMHHTSWVGDRVCEYIKNLSNDQEPFLCFAGFLDPHHPFTPPIEIARDFMNIDIGVKAPLDENINKKPKIVRETIAQKHMQSDAITLAGRYTYAMISLIDETVGRIIECLKKENIYEDTIIVFTSDHGDYLGDFEALTKSNCVCDALVHTPLIIKSGQKGINKKTVSNADVLPTILNMCGIEIPPNIQGEVISEKENDFAYAESYTGEGVGNNLTLYDDKYRYTLYTDTWEEELYCHETDPKEVVNIAEENPEKCKQMQLELMKRSIKYNTHTYNRVSKW